MRPSRATLLLAVVALAPGLGPVTATAATGAGPAAETETVVVTLRSRADLGAIAAVGRTARLRQVVEALRRTAEQSQAPLLGDLRGAVVQHRAHVDRRLWISNSVVVTATPAVVRALAARPDVARVQPDAIDLVPAALAPATPNQVAVGAPVAWTAGDTGRGVVVATLDSGVDVSHPDLSATWRGGTDSWYDPYGQHPAGPVDLTGHGTAVTGVMVGRDGSGATLGTAPDARWIAARVFDDSGAATLSAVHAAFQWVLDPDGDPATADAPQVVNASWALGAGPGCDLSLQPDVQALRRAGILPVFAAGNFGPGPGSGASPASYPEALSVGALLQTGEISALSSRGPSDCGGRTRAFPDLVAPGEDVLTTDRWGLYQYVSGTSIAAPHVAGALALLLAADPGLSADQQQALVTSSATDLGLPGTDDVYGHGRVDVAAMLASAPSPSPSPGPPPSPTPGPPPSPTPGPTPSPTPGPPPSPTPTLLTFSTHGLRNPPGVTGSPDDADLYSWNGTRYARAWDASAHGVPARAKVDGFARVDARHFYLSFATANVRLPGVGRVQDEDVVAYDDGTWSVFFDGTSHGLRSPALDVGAVVVAGGRLYFSTAGRRNPPGVRGAADDADVYAWNGKRFRRVWDASAHGVPAGAKVDGYARVDARHFSLSFATAVVRLPGIGRVQDEDVVSYDGRRWSVSFDGTAHSLAAAALDTAAFDLG